jgi:hypothetical protein
MPTFGQSANSWRWRRCNDYHRRGAADSAFWHTGGFREPTLGKPRVAHLSRHRPTDCRRVPIRWIGSVNDRRWRGKCISSRSRERAIRPSRHGYDWRASPAALAPFRLIRAGLSGSVARLRGAKVWPSAAGPALCQQCPRQRCDTMTSKCPTFRIPSLPRRLSPIVLSHVIQIGRAVLYGGQA